MRETARRTDGRVAIRNGSSRADGCRNKTGMFLALRPSIRPVHFIIYRGVAATSDILSQFRTILIADGNHKFSRRSIRFRAGPTDVDRTARASAAASERAVAMHDGPARHGTARRASGDFCRRAWRRKHLTAF